MGKCRFCGKNAGLMRSEHSRCRNIYEKGRRDIVAMVVRAVDEPDRIEGLGKEIDQLAGSLRIHDSDTRALAAKGWEQAVEHELSDHVLSEEEEHNLTRLLEMLDLAQDDLDQDVLNRVVQAGALRDVLNGKLPQRQKYPGRLPFNLQKSETLVWVFQGVDYYEEKTRSEFRGGSQGMSFRVAKGGVLSHGRLPGGARADCRNGTCGYGAAGGHEQTYLLFRRTEALSRPLRSHCDV